MNSKALYGAVLFGAVASLFVACGDGDSTKIVICNNKQVTCLNAQGGEVCSADGTLKLSFACSQGETCCDPKAGDEGCTDYTSGAAGENSVELRQAGCVSGCQPNATECATSKVSRVCSEDGRAWIPVACPAGTGCDPQTGECSRSENPDDTVTVCEQGQSTCADGNAVKECEEDGSNWIYKPCPTGTACTDGACVIDESVECVPHTGVCANKSTSRVCNDAGTGYDEIDCGDMECIDGLCRGPVCTKGEIRCDDVLDGNVFGQLLAGEYDANAVYTCNPDGTAWVISHCAQGEICVYDNIAATTINAYIEEAKAELERSGSSSIPVFDIPETSRAACVQPECAAPFALRELLNDFYQYQATGGSFVCGEPNGDNPLDSFSLCEGLPPYNNLHWANYACPDATQCRYEGAPSQSEGESGTVTGPVCAQTCRPGTKSCFQAFAGSPGQVQTTGESTIECGDDGEWDYTTVASCPAEGGREQWCGPNLLGESNYDIGTCMEPACAYWFQAYDTFALPEGVGACGTNGRFYQCLTDGTFGAASDDCAACALETRAANSGLPETYAGYDPGTCISCVEGQRACVIYDPFNPTTGTPFFRECVDGKLTVDTCPNGDICRTYTDLSQDSATYGLSNIVCGGECTPFATECGGTSGQQIRTCHRTGSTWGEFEDCDSGSCSADQTNGVNGVASCEAQCIRGTFECSGQSAYPCTSDLRYDYENPTTCADDQVCIADQGCKECDSGSNGRPATRCNPDDAAQIQVCQPDGTWGDPVDCPSSQPACGGFNPSATCGPDMGGSAGTAGVGGTAGTAGTGGDGGTAGTAGSAGNAGNAGGGMGGIPIDQF